MLVACIVAHELCQELWIAHDVIAERLPLSGVMQRIAVYVHAVTANFVLALV